MTDQNNLDTARAPPMTRRSNIRIWSADCAGAVGGTDARKALRWLGAQAGRSFITLMPLKTRLEAEIKIASRDIGFVRAGDRCTLKIDAFNSAEHGTAEGTIRWISEGAFTTDDDGQSRRTPITRRAAPSIVRTSSACRTNFRLIPGMTLTGESMSVPDRSPCTSLAACSGVSARRCESHDGSFFASSACSAKLCADGLPLNRRSWSISSVRSGMICAWKEASSARRVA